MSTKIWEAYRVKPGYDVWKVLWDIRRRAEKRVRDGLKHIYREMLKDAKRPPDERGLLSPLYSHVPVPEDLTTFSYLDASRFVFQNYCATIGKTERSFWDLSCSVVVRRARKNLTLLIPYPGSGCLSGSLVCLRRHKALADYHYQNQTDKPSHVSAKSWRERARVWEPLLDDERWQDKLVLDIVSPDGFFRVDPAWALMRREFKRTGALPGPERQQNPADE